MILGLFPKSGWVGVQIPKYCSFFYTFPENISRPLPFKCLWTCKCVSNVFSSVLMLLLYSCCYAGTVQRSFYAAVVHVFPLKTKPFKPALGIQNVSRFQINHFEIFNSHQKHTWGKYTVYTGTAACGQLYGGHLCLLSWCLLSLDCCFASASNDWDSSSSCLSSLLSSSWMSSLWSGKRRGRGRGGGDSPWCRL